MRETAKQEGPDTGELLAIDVGMQEAQIKAKEMQARITELEGFIEDQAMRAHHAYHQRREGHDNWRLCTRMVCLDARAALGEGIGEDGPDERKGSEKGTGGVT